MVGSMKWRGRVFGVFALLGLLPLGCGGKTGLDPYARPHDAGPSDGASPDAMPAELVVDCGRSRQYTSPRQAIVLEALAESPDGVSSQSWILLGAPAGSMSSPSPLEGSTTTLVPDTVGDYRIRHTAVDGAGRIASCEVTVEAVVGPPVAICPEDELLVLVSEPLTVPGDAFDDDGVIVTASWRLIASPPGATATIEPLDTLETIFRADRTGRYRLELTVSDLDAATDSCETAIRVIAPPVLECPSGAISGPTRRPLMLSVPASDDTEIVAVRWEVRDRPARSVSEPEPSDADPTRFTPDRRGSYTLRFTATDTDGLSSICDLRIEGTPTSPDAICVDVESQPWASAEVPGDAVDDGEIVAWSWTLLSRPAGSSGGDPMPANRQNTTVDLDSAGDYQLQLTVTDDDGNTASCISTVHSVPSEGLRIEMYWNSPSDMDLHLLHPDGTRWVNSTDCYYANCTGRGLEWFSPGPDDNPRLDRDNIPGFNPDGTPVDPSSGAENINIDVPADGVYRVGVHAFGGRSSGVIAKIYCGASSTEPTRVFGPVRLEAGADIAFWRVADVTIRGPSCTITDLSSGGRPNLSSHDDAQRRR